MKNPAIAGQIQSLGNSVAQIGKPRSVHFAISGEFAPLSSALIYHEQSQKLNQQCLPYFPETIRLSKGLRRCHPAPAYPNAMSTGIAPLSC